MNITETYWTRMRALPNQSRAMRYYISLANTGNLDASKEAWDALSDDEQALCRSIRIAARNAVLEAEGIHGAV